MPQICVWVSSKLQILYAPVLCSRLLIMTQNNSSSMGLFWLNEVEEFFFLTLISFMLIRIDNNRCWLSCSWFSLSWSSSFQRCSPEESSRRIYRPIISWMNLSFTSTSTCVCSIFFLSPGIEVPSTKLLSALWLPLPLISSSKRASCYIRVG